MVSIRVTFRSKFLKRRPTKEYDNKGAKFPFLRKRALQGFTFDVNVRVCTRSSIDQGQIQNKVLKRMRIKGYDNKGPDPSPSARLHVINFMLELRLGLRRCLVSSKFTLRTWLLKRMASRDHDHMDRITPQLCTWRAWSPSLYCILH